MKQLLIEALAPVVSAMLAIVIPALLAGLFTSIKKWTGVEVEARHREALQSALANAARLMAAGASRAAGIDYVKKSVPDALKVLNATDRIGELLAPHVVGRTLPNREEPAPELIASHLAGLKT